MPESKRPLKVFLCHAHSDQVRVRDLYNRLTNDGVDVWLDKEKLLPGQDWELEIQKAVRESDVVIVCLSQQFNQRGFRQKEVQLALDTAMEQPEGEIFIIPAKLEECENLQSLKKWHEVDLFEDVGYERLMMALQTRAKNIGAVTKLESKNKLPLLVTDSQFPIVNNLNWEISEPSVIFEDRLRDAFPGLRGIEKFVEENAVDRLEILLRNPLVINMSNGSENVPFWWVRGFDSMNIQKFERLDKSHILLDIYELRIDYIVVVRHRNRKKNFIYAQVLPDEPTGLYNYKANEIGETLQWYLGSGHGFFVSESYGIWEGKFLSREEYDDGATVMNGKPVLATGAKLRERYITPYNIVICSQDHILNSGEVDEEASEFLDSILLGTKTVDDLIGFVDKLPRTKRS